MRAGVALLSAATGDCETTDYFRYKSIHVNGATLVSVRAETGSITRRCAGIRVGEDTVVTAAHCVSSARRVLVSDVTSVVVSVSVAKDVARLKICGKLPKVKIDFELTPASCLAAIALPPKHAESPWRVREATIVAETRSSILALSAPSVAPCAGDSGAPLLGCDADVCLVLGMLRGGSAWCTGTDTFVTMDTIDTSTISLADAQDLCATGQQPLSLPR